MKQAPSPAGEGWSEENQHWKNPFKLPLILAFSATAPSVALPPVSMRSSLKREGRGFVEFLTLHQP
jgi:hypothetical protein